MAGFTQVHVSGLSEDAADADVEAELKRGLLQRLTIPKAVASNDSVAEQGEGQTGVDPKDDFEEGADTFTSCVVVRCKTTSKCKGYCFLSFDSRDQADSAVVLLNAGVTVGGQSVLAQIAQKKERPVKAKDPTEHLNDLRIGRKSYQAGSKKAIHGHKTCSDLSQSVTTFTGRMNAVAGTRGQRIIDPSAKLSSRSGFVA
eukprot:TRINITY_DN9389_c0_g1_i1.p1 TRINITY_DN9389_c0_g1~~TRINITY_DN9389_c0_g1_i1.p1  ORF type:complete len:215 (+),score=26.16 TRINITY_DN9389_c0_g1_i1:46-645(+)